MARSKHRSSGHSYPGVSEFLTFLAKEAKHGKTKDPLSGAALYRLYQKHKNVPPTEHVDYLLLDNVRKKIFVAARHGFHTRAKMMFISSARVTSVALRELQKHAEVKLDSSCRIEKYKANDGSMYLKGDHSVQAKTAREKAARKKEESKQREAERRAAIEAAARKAARKSDREAAAREARASQRRSLTTRATRSSTRFEIPVLPRRSESYVSHPADDNLDMEEDDEMDNVVRMEDADDQLFLMDEAGAAPPPVVERPSSPVASASATQPVVAPSEARTNLSDNQSEDQQDIKPIINRTGLVSSDDGNQLPRETTSEAPQASEASRTPIGAATIAPSIKTEVPEEELEVVCTSRFYSVAPSAVIDTAFTLFTPSNAYCARNPFNSSQEESDLTDCKQCLMSLRGLIIMLDTPNLQPIRTEIEEAVKKFGTKNKKKPVNALLNVLQTALMIVADTAQPITPTTPSTSSSAATSSTSNDEFMSLYKFLVQFRTYVLSIMNESILHDLDTALKGGLSTFQIVDKKIPISRVLFALRAVLMVITN